MKQLKRLRAALSIIWRDLGQPSQFKGDWFGWVSGQLAHAFAGAFVSVTLCVIWYMTIGEYPVRIWLWLVIAFGYIILIERRQHGGRFDTFEDWLFVAGYGAGAPLLILKEVTPGHPEFTGIGTDVIPLLVVLFIHVSIGAISRAQEGDE